jgi:predicted DCC family thiol-disulfide oxidoreductase YuxK
MRHALLQRMRFHSQIYTPSDEHIRFSLCESSEEVRASTGGYATHRSRTLKSGYVSDKPILIYDGICNLCTTVVRFLNALDHGCRLQYIPSQELGERFRNRYGLTEARLQGQMHLFRRGSVTGGVTAIREICKLLTPFGVVCNSLAVPPAQQVYDRIARSRYRLFGCRDTCYVAYREHSDRLD